MKRGGFAPKHPPKPARQYEGAIGAIPRPTACARDDGKARLVVPVPKEQPVEHEGYRRLVAMLPCIRCRRWGRSQCAHPNSGKGMGAKTDDRLCFPLCADNQGYVGCHTLFDQHALFTKTERRKKEPAWGWATRTAIRAAGLWPKGLEHWPEDEEQHA